MIIATERNNRIGAKTLFDSIAAERGPLQGMLVGSTDVSLTEILGQVGYDFIILDCEHSPMGPMEMIAHVRAAERSGIVPIIRVWELNRSLIQKALDAGAEGIVIPHVESAAEARVAVEATRFPGSGSRSYCPSTHASNFSASYWATSFERHTTENIMVIPLIESQAGLDHVDEIFDTDGVEAVFFGPGDYTFDIGLRDMTADAVTTAWRKVVESARAHGKKAIGTSLMRDLNAEPVAGVVHGMDLMNFGQAAAQLLEQFKAARR